VVVADHRHLMSSVCIRLQMVPGVQALRVCF